MLAHDSNPQPRRGDKLIWTSARRSQPHAAPTYSVSGAKLHWGDYSPAQVQQEPFRWVGDAWEANLTLSRAGASSPVPAILRLTPSVWDWWTKHGVNPETESARQLALEIPTRDWTKGVGTITLQTTNGAAAGPMRRSVRY